MAWGPSRLGALSRTRPGHAPARTPTASLQAERGTSPTRGAQGQARPETREG